MTAEDRRERFAQSRAVADAPRLDEQAAETFGREAARIVALSVAPWLSAADAAAYLRFPSVGAFRKWAARAAVPSCRLGARTVRFARHDLDAALTRPRGHGRQPATRRAVCLVHSVDRR